MTMLVEVLPPVGTKYRFGIIDQIPVGTNHHAILMQILYFYELK